MFTILFIPLTTFYLYKASRSAPPNPQIGGNKTAQIESSTADNDNQPYIGQIEHHYCSKKSAIEVDLLLKDLGTDLDNSERILSGIISKDKDCVLAIHTLGTVYSFKKDYQNAFKLYTKALKLAPNTAVIHQSFAAVYFKTGDAESAIYHLHRALEYERNMWSAHRGLATVYYTLGEYHLSKKHYLKVIELSDDKEYVQKVKEIVRRLENEGY